MTYAVELYVELDIEAQVYDLWQSLKAANVSSRMVDGHFRPHISLGVCEQIDLDQFRPILQEFARDTSRFSVWLPSIGFFLTEKAVVYIGVTPTQFLLDVHRQFQAAFLPYIEDQNRYYEVDNWVPHITLADDVEPGNLPRAMTIITQSAPTLLNQYVEIQEIGVVDTRNGETQYYCELGADPETN